MNNNIIKFPTKEELEEKLENNFLESLTPQQNEIFGMIISKINEEYNEMCEELDRLHKENKKLKNMIKGLKNNAKI